MKNAAERMPILMASMLWKLNRSEVRAGSTTGENVRVEQAETTWAGVQGRMRR